jgi:hypothetical protein
LNDLKEHAKDLTDEEFEITYDDYTFVFEWTHPDDPKITETYELYPGSKERKLTR